jgi:microcystin-dependent protein
MSVANAIGYDNYPLPIGTIFPYAGVAQGIPSDVFILCDGRSLLRSEYPELFEVIEDIYGAVDADHFNIPDCVGRYIQGINLNAGTTTAGGSGGEQLSLLIAENNLPSLDTYDGTKGIQVTNPVASISGDHEYVEADVPSEQGSKPDPPSGISTRNAANSGMTSINVNYVAGSLSVSYNNGAQAPVIVDFLSASPASFNMTYYIKAKY